MAWTCRWPSRGRRNCATGQGINDVFNRPNQKSIAANSQPLVLVTAFNYEVPRFSENKVMRAVASGWTVGGLLRYSSGIPIAVPTATSNLSNFILQDTRMNRVPGEPLYTKDLNCGCIDPNKDFVLNPKAWVNPAPGEWGVSPVFYSDYRHQRRPSEQFSFGRMFRVKERASFSIRAEFFNAFNRIVCRNRPLEILCKRRRPIRSGRPNCRVRSHRCDYGQRSTQRTNRWPFPMVNV